jgi:hypothetical protein
VDEAAAWTDRAATAELITRYAALNDAGDWDAVAALYTEGGAHEPADRARAGASPSDVGASTFGLKG